MTGFHGNRSLNALGEEDAAPPVGQSLARTPSQQQFSALSPEDDPASRIDDKVSGEADSVKGSPAAGSQNILERYEAWQAADGWSVLDRHTGDTAQVYGYLLGRLSQRRAESLVEVLNRGEARRRGRNG